MKIRYAVITSIILFIAMPIFSENYFNLNYELQQILTIIVVILWTASLGLIAYLILRNIFCAIKGAITGRPQGGNYQAEARNACEKVTPKRKQDIAPPWEK